MGFGIATQRVLLIADTPRTSRSSRKPIGVAAGNTTFVLHQANSILPKTLNGFAQLFGTMISQNVLKGDMDTDWLAQLQ